MCSFDKVIKGLKKNKTYAREGWNGKDQSIFMTRSSDMITNNKQLTGKYKPGTCLIYEPFVTLNNAQGQIVPWLPSQGDMLADDWFEVSYS